MLEKHSIKDRTVKDVLDASATYFDSKNNPEQTEIYKDYTDYPASDAADVVVGLLEASISFGQNVVGIANLLTVDEVLMKRARAITYDPFTTGNTLPHELMHSMGIGHPKVIHRTLFYPNSIGGRCSGPEILKGQTVGSLTSFYAYGVDEDPDDIFTPSESAFVPITGSEFCGNDVEEADALSTIIETRNYIAAIHKQTSSPFDGGIEMSLDYIESKEEVEIRFTRKDATSNGRIKYILYTKDYIGRHLNDYEVRPGFGLFSSAKYNLRPLPINMQTVKTAEFEEGVFEVVVSIGHPQAKAPTSFPEEYTLDNLTDLEYWYGEPWGGSTTEGPWVNYSLGLVIIDAQEATLPQAIELSIPREKADLTLLKKNVPPVEENTDSSEVKSNSSKSGAINPIYLMFFILIVNYIRYGLTSKSSN